MDKPIKNLDEAEVAKYRMFLHALKLQGGMDAVMALIELGRRWDIVVLTSRNPTTIEYYYGGELTRTETGLLAEQLYSKTVDKACELNLPLTDLLIASAVMVQVQMVVKYNGDMQRAIAENS